MDVSGHKCHTCGKKFSEKSNLTRHMKTHSERTVTCDICNKIFLLQQNLDRHKKVHTYPSIPLYKPNEARLKSTPEADRYAKEASSFNPDKVWLDVETAESKARKLGGEQWRACLVLTWGKYAGKTFKWLLENDIGWAVWILSEFIIKGDANPLMNWQKEQLLNLTRNFPPIMVHVDKRVKVRLGLVLYL